MSRSDAQALADRLRTDVRAGAFALADVSTPTPAAPTMADVADRHLRDYARRDTRKPHAVRQFEIHVRLLLQSVVDTAGLSRGALGAVPFSAVTRADLDAVFRARLDAVNAALAAARQVAALQTEKRAVPADLLKSATLAGRSTKGGHFGLNRFKRHGVNVVCLDGAAETVRTRRLQPGEEERLVEVATPHLRRLLVAALSTGCRLGELLSLQWRDVQCDAAGRARAPVLRAGKTKTGTLRVVPVGQRLAAVLEMLRTDPEGEVLPPDAYSSATRWAAPSARSRLRGAQRAKRRAWWACTSTTCAASSRAGCWSRAPSCTTCATSSVTPTSRPRRATCAPRRCAWSARCVCWRSRRRRASERRPWCVRGILALVPHQCHMGRLGRTTSTTRSTRKPLKRWNLEW